MVESVHRLPSMSLRSAIAGTGFIGAVHAAAVRAAGGTVTGVLASSPARGAAAAQRLGAGRSYSDEAELLADADVDVVHVCTPNHLHAELAEAALAAGRHVVCEKPLATTSDAAERLAAAAGDRVAAVPFVYRYYPTVREARRRVGDGTSGPVHLVHGTYLQDWLLSAQDDNWRVDAELGGASRAFADIGSHWCDLAEFVTGHRVSRLSARTTIAVPDRVHDAGRAAFARAPAPARRAR
jgi:predicted dehydrogenase